MIKEAPMNRKVPSPKTLRDTRAKRRDQDERGATSPANDGAAGEDNSFAQRQLDSGEKAH